MVGYATHCPFKQYSVSVEKLSADSCPAEFDVLKTNICGEANMLDLSIKIANHLNCYLFRQTSGQIVNHGLMF